MNLIIIVAYSILCILSIRRVLLSVKDPAKSFSWILVIILIPIIGMVIFYLLGNSLKKDIFFNQKSAFYNTSDQVIKPNKIKASKIGIATLLHKNKSSSISYHNKLIVLTENNEIFKNIFYDIKNATKSIHLEFYIIEDGEILKKLLALLYKKVQQGVKVKIIYDGYGSINFRKILIQKANNYGIEVKEFMPFSFWGYLRFMNYRNHRKIIIIDNEIAYTGGMNISDNYLRASKTKGLWKDVFIRIEGEASNDLEKIFNTDWFYAKGSEYTLSPSKIDTTFSIPVQIVSSGPNSIFQGILHEYFSIITDAEEYVYIITPYFVPGEALFTALKTSALSGIDIRIMLPYNSDSKWLKWCMFSYLEDVLGSGVKIYLHHQGFLHSKIMISDNCIASIGTANVDERSFNTNFEINAIAYDKEVTLTLKNYFFTEIKQCEELSLVSFSKRNDRNKILESIARLTSPLL